MDGTLYGALYGALLWRYLPTNIDHFLRNLLSATITAMSYQETETSLHKMKSGNYLSLDGRPNGLSGLPAFYVLKEMLERLKRDLNLDKAPLPCDWFGLFMGTGLGAVDAILLGRLRMPILQAIEAYEKLLPALSVQPSQDEEERGRNSEAFKTAFTQVLVDAGFSPDTLMLDDNAPKTAICTLRPTIATSPYIIRSYRVRGAPSPNFTILQAACASIASPNTFSSLVYGTGYQRLELTSAIVGFANPTRELLREAVKTFGKEARVGAIVNIGVEDTKLADGIDASSAATEAGFLSQILMNSERVHRNVETRLTNTDIYFRFSIKLKLDRDAIVSAMSAYLGDEEISEKLDKATTKLHQPLGSVTLDEINSVNIATVALDPRPSVVPHFIGRQEILDSLREAHFSESTLPNTSLPIVSVLRGLGGSGKTQIALKLALEFESIFPGVSVYFVDASSESKLQDAYQTIIRAQSPSHRSESYEDALIWLATQHKDWLVIMDNADDPTVSLYQYIPKSSHGHVLITTRNETYSGLAPNSSHHVEGLPPADSISLLLQVSRYEDDKVSHRYAQEITEAVGYLPLAITHAAAYIGIHRCLSTYMKMYNQNKAKILALNEKVLPEDYRTPVSTTIQMSIERLSPEARDAMHVLAQLNATSIAHDIIQHSAERQFSEIDRRTDEEALDERTIKQANALMTIFCPGGEWEEFKFNKIVEECLQYSLLRVTGQGKTKFYSMHILVQSYLNTRFNPVQGCRPNQLMVRLLSSAITISNSHVYLQYNRLVVPHVRLIKTTDVIEAGDHRCFANVLEEQGSALLASQHLECCVKIRKRVLGDNHYDTLEAMSELAVSYHKLGMHREALELMEVVLKMRKQLLGDDHPDTLVAMSIIASLYSDMGRYQDAMELEENVLEMRKHQLGDGHREIMVTMQNLASSYSQLGRYQDALALEEEVLKMRKRLVGDDRPDTVQAMNNLALSYGNVGRHKDALELIEAVLKAQKQLLGDDHPDTVTAMGNLAALYSDIGRYQDAMELEEKVLEMQKHRLGDDHRDTVLTMNNLALSYCQLGRYQEALDLQEEVFKKRKQLLGDDHPDTVRAMGSLALFYSDIGQHRFALNLGRKVLKMQKQPLGNDHPDTMRTLSNLSSFYYKLGRYQKALEFGTKTMQMRTQNLGEEHPDTLLSMQNILVILDRPRMQKQRLALLHKALPLFEKVHGKGHSDTMQIQAWIDKISPSNQREEELEDEDWEDTAEDLEIEENRLQDISVTRD